MNKNICFIIFFIIIFSSYIKASNTKQDFGIWGNVSIYGSLGDKDSKLHKVKYFVADRQSNMSDSTRFSQNLFLAGMGYAISPNWTLMSGWGYMYTRTPYVKNSVHENRIWEQALWHEKYNYFSLASRTRLEQRFIQHVSNVPIRLREMVKLSIPLSFLPNYSVITSNEIFWNVNGIGNSQEYGSNGLSQNRFFLGIGYKINDNIKVSIGYLNQYLRRINGLPSYMGNVINGNLNVSL